MSQLSDKNKKNREDNPFDSFLPPDTQWENFKLKWLIGGAVLLILGGLLLMVKDIRNNPTSLPVEGCYYFSQKHFDRLNNANEQSYYSITINKKEFTLYTNDIKVWNSYRKEYPDAYLIKCYTEEDVLNSEWKEIK